MPDGSSPDAGTRTATGSFTITDPNGLTDIDLIQIGPGVFERGDEFLLDLSELEGASVDVGFGIVTLTDFTATDPNTGTFTFSYELDETVDNDSVAGATDTEFEESFDIVVSDGNSLSATGTVAVNIVDDVPSISEMTANADGAVSTDESTQLFTLVSGTASVFTGGAVTLGADGGSSDVTLQIDDTASGLSTINGQAITLVNGADDTSVVGQYNDGSETPATAFTISISDTGVLSVTQFVALDHPVDTNPNDSLNLTGKLSAVVTATDGDGDEASESVSIGASVEFLDDGPSISEMTANADGAVSTDESTQLFTLVSGTASVFTGGAVTLGADGGSSDVTLQIDDTASGLSTIDGQAITLVNGADDTSVVGQYNDGSETPATAFTISISDTGVLSVTQFVALDHPVDTNPNDSLNLTGKLSAVVTATDGDGDEASESVSIGASVEFLDDGPSISEMTANADGAVSTDESTQLFTLVSGTASVFTGGAVTLGADGGSSDVTLQIDDTASGLSTIDGQAITLVNGADDTSVVGQYNDGSETPATAFTISISDTGVLSVTQFVALDHPVDTNPNDSLNLTGKLSAVVTATDGDGDEASESVSIGASVEFLDDGPSISEMTANADGAVSTDESTQLFTLVSGTASVFTGGAVTLGADGGSSDVTLQIDDTASGLSTIDGQAITLVNGADDTSVVGQYNDGSETPATAFTISISDTGVLSVTQFVALDHPVDTNPHDSLNLTGKLSAVVMATDGDGDEASESVSIGASVEFLDDGPSISEMTANADGAVSTDEHSALHFGFWNGKCVYR